MGVMDHYVRRGMSGVPAPGGVALPPGLSAFVDLFTPLLTQARVDLLTAWATRVDATSWEPNPMPPSTNVAIFGLTDQALQAAQAASFQQTESRRMKARTQQYAWADPKAVPMESGP